MKIIISDRSVPGTILQSTDCGGLTGMEFLNRVFFLKDGVMLSQIREISGIDGSTLQNWTKRGWVANAPLKKYNMDQVAHILIINMLRSCMQLDKINFLIQYINGSVEDRSDDIIGDALLYDHICKVLSEMENYDECDIDKLREIIVSVTKDYKEPVDGAHTRLNNALEIIAVAYTASLFKRNSDEKLDKLIADSSN